VSSESGRVDYETVAARYHHGRALSAETVARWRRAVVPHLPAGRPGRVVDVGAGTGLFLPVWVSWDARQVVAIEPSVAMRREATGSGFSTGAAIIGGVAEQLPLRDHCADVVWMSTVFLQLADRGQAILLSFPSLALWSA
jgi:ubiquinone/menaquinone biosynthesis C-methylase UbiE